MKTVGILTMHRVLNYGSALQAWATQEVIKRLGYEVKVIDYIFPNEYHRQFATRVPIVINIARFLRNLRYGYPMKKKQHAFELFRKSYMQLSQTYKTKEELKCNPPVFDIYVAGSDQIWNPDGHHGDMTFFLDFLPQTARRISYASSFAQKAIKRNRGDIKSCLDKFYAISVREQNGKKIVKELIHREAMICCDPTLLLEKKDYAAIEKYVTVKIEKPFILVYILNYAFNPYPYATEFIKEAYRQTSFHVVCLDFSSRQHLGIRNCTNLHDSVSPSDFVWLFSNAEMVITSSFHGTAFALNFERPFYSIVNKDSSEDDRITSLLKECRAEYHIFKKGDSFPDFKQSQNFEESTRMIQNHRKNSIDYLRNNLER